MKRASRPLFLAIYLFIVKIRMSQALIAEHLSKTYRHRKAVDDFGLRVEEGEVVGLLGPNGAGKTTSFYMIVGLIASDRGSIFIGDVNITHAPIHRRAALGLAYLPQESSVFRRLTVEENILAILQLIETDPRTQRNECERLISAFGLEKVRDSLGASLSGGERRRVEIARALATHPKFVLLDEPFAGVDPLNIRAIKTLILDLKSRGIGVLLTDHNARETLDTCDRVYVMIEGKVLVSGTSAEIARHSLARTHYLGEDFAL